MNPRLKLPLPTCTKRSLMALQSTSRSFSLDESFHQPHQPPVVELVTIPATRPPPSDPDRPDLPLAAAARRPVACRKTPEDMDRARIPTDHSRHRAPVRDPQWWEEAAVADIARDRDRTRLDQGVPAVEATTVTTAVVAVVVIVAEEKGSADDTAMKTCWGLSQPTERPALRDGSREKWVD
jgi:hypothetical protein